MPTAKYIATDKSESAIYGVGSTEDEAINDAMQQFPELTGLVAYPAEPELIALVEDMGGNVAFDINDRGVAVIF